MDTDKDTEQKEQKTSPISVGVDVFVVALLIIFFAGEPDLVDALIYWLMK